MDSLCGVLDVHFGTVRTWLSGVLVPSAPLAPLLVTVKHRTTGAFAPTLPQRSTPWTALASEAPRVLSQIPRGAAATVLHDADRQAYAWPPKPNPHQEAFWMGVLDPSGSPPIPHPNSLWMGFFDGGPVKSHPNFVQHNRFFPALPRAAEKKRHLIGPASF